MKLTMRYHRTCFLPESPQNAVPKHQGKKTLLNPATHVLLQMMAFMYNRRPALRSYLKGVDGWINFTIGFKIKTGSMEQAMRFHDGKVAVLPRIPAEADVVLHFVNDAVFKEMLKVHPSEMLHMILKNRIILDGNLAYLQLFNYYVALLLGKKHQRMLKKTKDANRQARKKEYGDSKPELSEEFHNRCRVRLRCKTIDPGVRYLKEAYLADYGLDDFPRLQSFLDDHFTKKPAVCVERAELLTKWYREHGFETDTDGLPWVPELRQAQAFHYLMHHKKPVIRKNDLVAGTTTLHETTGGLVYPDAQGTMIWGELTSIDQRTLMPFAISAETARTLHHDVFPFWAKRNFREWVRTNHAYPMCQKIDERWVAYFVWKSVGISHTIPEVPRVLAKGTLGIIQDIEARLQSDAEMDESSRNTLRAMALSLQGVNAYAKHLSEEATTQARHASHPQRKAELLRLAEICAKVPAHPATTLDEAINAVWIVWVGLLNENADTGLSLGRLDQCFQPYFEHDMAQCTHEEERTAYIRQAIELVGCFYMRLTDHFPLGPDIANFLFGGASSTQAITLGGVTPDGRDAVNDMTYIFLKVTEMLAIRDANINARFHPEHNSVAYLKRLCEVNFITAGTPSMHNDIAVFQALQQHGYPLEDIRDWSSTGCVEPTLTGKHMGHTGSILMNLVAGLEMALNNGYHPLMDWHLGTQSGSIEADDFKTFEDFFEAYATQQKFLIDQAVSFNNLLAKAHTQCRPTPLLSACIDGVIDSAKDVTRGGARYNTSGTSNIGLADVTDSLMVIKKLVFDEKKISFAALKQAIDTNFSNDPALRALVQNKVALFGSGSEEAIAMANRVSGMVHDHYHAQRNFRGGAYTTGFWSMSQHVAYGTLSGALPSGRLAGKPFTPGLTPHPSASKNFLDNIRDVAHLHAKHMDNNIAFNVKLLPNVHDSREKTVHTMHSYVKAFFDLGGMQMQFNVVTSATLRDAMANPEQYRNLLVRISGYNAYFVSLDPEIQMELVERAEYGL